MSPAENIATTIVESRARVTPPSGRYAIASRGSEPLTLADRSPPNVRIALLETPHRYRTDGCAVIITT
ncbi:hypothetical protein [Rubidibacter lacunae]|uniref:hypothetical protein n=1 Tax=Rubidibacter lacunae TaxID=582514 RepID=UPI0012EC5F62|nr:hypothetical protein [Rubidibacter lacunae]